MLCDLQIYVGQMDDPCKVDDRDWYITIFNCDGSVLEYAGQQFLLVHAPNGNLSVKIPEGKYYAVGVWSYWPGPDGTYFGNHFTHKTPFAICCGGHKCVWLYNPSIHTCGIVYDQAVQDFQNNINQTEQDLINDPDVEPTDPRFAAIEDARNAIATNLPAMQAMNVAIRNFAEVFGFAVMDGTDINQIDLLNNMDVQHMDELVARNSEKIPESVRIDGEITAKIY
jgi:hypothetical protein